MGSPVMIKPGEQDALIHDLIVAGDTSRLSAAQKTQFFMRTCHTLGLNPVTQPFAFIKLNGKEVLYAKKDATEQLRKVNGVSIDSMDGKTVADIYVVTVKVRDAQGRTDIATGAVNVKGLSGDNMANAIMKAETKAKRRATLSICGLGILDESEIETIPGAVVSEPLPSATSVIEFPKPETAIKPEYIPAPKPAEAVKPSPTQHQNSAGRVGEGESIPGDYWKQSAAGKVAMLAEGCKAEKVNGVWTCVRK